MEFQTGSGHRGGPISYAVNGRQYIATPSGWGSFTAGRLAEFFPSSRAPGRAPQSTRSHCPNAPAANNMETKD